MKSEYYDIRISSNGSSALESQTILFTVWEGSRGVQESAKPSAVTPVSHPEKKINTFAVAAVFSAVLIILFAVWFTFDMTHAAAVQEKLDMAAVEQVVVQPGDTLWTIADEHSISGISTAEMVEFLKSFNSLTQSSLEVGQQLFVATARS